MKNNLLGPQQGGHDFLITPCNGGDCLIQVSFTVKRNNFQDFGEWPPTCHRGRLAYTGLHNNASLTVWNKKGEFDKYNVLGSDFGRGCGNKKNTGSLYTRLLSKT